MKKLIGFILCICLTLLVTSCGNDVTWNGKIECLGELTMVLDFTNLYEYVGIVDHVFIGTVERADYSIPVDVTQYAQSFSQYQIHVDRNLKGELIENIECSKMGGLKNDRTMLLVAAETPNGKLVMDTGLPEVGKQYIFLAYTQPDGSLTLSEIFDNREYTDALLVEYLDYVDNEVAFERERFVSEYSNSAE